MQEKSQSGFNVQKIRDAYIASVEAKMASFAAALRELEALNEERKAKGKRNSIKNCSLKISESDLEENYSQKQINGYKEQILGLERELEILTNERDSLKVENQHLQIVVNGVKQEYKSFKYQNEPGHIIKSKELENNELKKEVEVMKSIMKRLEKDLWKYQENDININLLKDRNKQLEEDLKETQENLQKTKALNSVLEDKVQKGPFSQDILSMVLKNGNVSEQLKKQVDQTQKLIKELEDINADLEKNLNEKTSQTKRLMEENTRLTGKVTELEEKEKKFYYQEMVFDQELQKKSREDLITIWENVKQHFINYEAKTHEEKLVLFEIIRKQGEALLESSKEVQLLKARLLLQTKQTEEHKFKYEVLYHGIFAPSMKDETRQSKQGNKMQVIEETMEDVKNKLTKANKKLFYIEEESQLAWRRVREYEKLLNIKEEEITSFKSLHQEDEIRIKRFQIEATYLHRANKFLGALNRVFTEYTQSRIGNVGSKETIPTQEFAEKLKSFVNQMDVMALRVLKISDMDLKYKTTINKDPTNLYH